MRISFWKMQGAGNDFILVDDRSGSIASPDRILVERLCARRTGIGADGLMLIQSSETSDFRLRFFNADGSEADMCGNGARCAARLAHDLGAANAGMLIETRAGILSAELVSEAVRIAMPPPSDWRSREFLQTGGQRLGCEFINTGVPHVVVDVPDLDGVDLQGLGAALRHHKSFAPEGANVNFMHIPAAGAMRIRTYERGVEAETLACGTGAVACALVAGRAGRAASPVRVVCMSGDRLEVRFRLTSGGAEDVRLLGPAVHVFKGELVIRQ